jgi:hypothetical protein
VESGDSVVLERTWVGLFMQQPVKLTNQDSLILRGSSDGWGWMRAFFGASCKTDARCPALSPPLWKLCLALQWFKSVCLSEIVADPRQMLPIRSDGASLFVCLS